MKIVLENENCARQWKLYHKEFQKSRSVVQKKKFMTQWIKYSPSSLPSIEYKIPFTPPIILNKTLCLISAVRIEHYYLYCHQSVLYISYLENNCTVTCTSDWTLYLLLYLIYRSPCLCRHVLSTALHVSVDMSYLPLSMSL